MSNNNALIVAVGTTAGGILQILRRILRDNPLVEGLGVLHVDSDGTMAFAHLPSELVQANRREGWGPNAFVHIPPPLADVGQAIQRGERLGFDHVPPAVLNTVNGDGVGVGGLVPLGNAAAILHEPRVRGAIRGLINRVSAHRTELNEENDGPLVVFEIAVSLGGTWGALEEVHDVIATEADRMRIPVSFQRTVLFPGQHPTRDMDSSMTNAAAWMREYAARASGRYLLCDRSSNGDLPDIAAAHASPTWIVSDMNAAPGRSATLPTPDALFTLAAYWHWLWIATPLGPRLEQDLVDFRDDALAVDVRGERRVGRTWGLSFVTLNHERIELYATARLVRASLSLLMAPVEEVEVQSAARAFNRVNRLYEGAGHTDLTSAIRMSGSSSRPVDQVERLRHLIDENLAGLEGVDLLRNGPAIIDATVRQTAEITDHFQKSRDAKVAEAEVALDEQIRHWLGDPEYGALFVQRWLGDQQRNFEHQIRLAAEDRRVHSERMDQFAETLRRLDEETVQGFLGMGRIRRWFNRRNIAQVGERWLRNRRALEMARREDQARTVSVTALDAIVDAIATRHAAVTRLLDELGTTVTNAASEQARIAAWDGTHTNPNGFQLDHDLDGYFRRVVGRPDQSGGTGDAAAVEHEAALDLLVALQDRGDLLFLAAEAGSIGREVATLARDRVAPRIAGLHVQDELFRRHPVGSESLMAFLRERDREAHERITFTGNADHDSPVQILRFVVGDARRGGDLVNALNAAVYVRGQANGNAQYVLVPAPHMDRISMVQVRLSFPPSQIGLHGPCVDAYDVVSRDLQFERCHTELVGRFLPRPGARAMALDTQVALVKAFALAGVGDGRGGPALELSGGDGLTLIRWEGEREPVGADLAVFDHILRRYDVRVELATRFYTAWRLNGPDVLSHRVRSLESVLSSTIDRRIDYERPLDVGPVAAEPGDEMAAAVARVVSHQAVRAVADELLWYARNTSPAACYWSGSRR